MKKTNFLIKTYKNFFLDRTGNHLSKFSSGSGLDFKDLREYVSTDEVRHINWKVTAKIRKPIVNEFYENRQISIIVVLLNSGSLYFGSVKQKINIAKEIFYLLSASAIYNKDKTKSLILSSFIEKEYFLNKKLLNLVEFDLKNIDCLNKTIDYSLLNNYLLSQKKKSVIFLIGDFFDKIDFKLIAKKHELNLIVIRDRFEEEPAFLGELNLIDTNNFNSIEMFLDKEVLNLYKNELKKHDFELFNHLYKNNIRYKKIYTDENILVKLREFLK